MNRLIKNSKSSLLRHINSTDDISELFRLSRSYFEMLETEYLALHIFENYLYEFSVAFSDELISNDEAAPAQFFDSHASTIYKHLIGNIFLYLCDKPGYEPQDPVFDDDSLNTFGEVLLVRSFQYGSRMAVLSVANRTPKDLDDQLPEIFLVSTILLDRILQVQASELIADISLSRRETECMSLTVRGKTSPEIGMILGLSQHTINNYINSACTKLKAANRKHAVARFNSLYAQSA